MEGSEAGEKRCEDSSHVEPVASPKSIHDKNDETDDIDVENDAEISAQHIEKDDSYRLKEANEESKQEEVSERPASADSARSGSSVNSIPPLPPLPASSGSTFPPQRSSVISINSQIDGKNKFSASFLATPSTVSSPVKNLQKRLLTKSNSDGFFRHGSNSLSTDKDCQMIGADAENPLGTQCTIRKNIQFDQDDVFIKTFQLYWYVDSSKGCLESPILSKRVHSRSSTNPIEPPYFVITKNQRRHQAYSCTFCKGKTTFITIVQALRHLKANHRHNVRVLVQDPKGVFSVPSSSSGGLAGNVVPTVPVVSPWSLPPRPFLPLPLSNTFNPTLLSTVPSTIPSAIPSYLTPSLRPLQRTTSDIPAEALDDTSRLTSENITYLKNILTQKLGKSVVEVNPRGGDEVTVVFSDNKSRVVRLANENSAKSDSAQNSAVQTAAAIAASLKSVSGATSSVLSSGFEPPAGLPAISSNFPTNPTFPDIPKAKLLRTVSATVNPHYSHLHDTVVRPNQSFSKSRLGEAGDSVVSDYYQAPTKSKYAAKMDYINKKNEIDTAKTNMYKSFSRLSKNGNETDDDNSLVNGGYDTDKEVSESRDQPNQDARSHRSNSTIDVDSNFMDTPQNENQNEETPSLHGHSVNSESAMSPLFKICDYSSGSLAEHAMLKMEVDKPKLDSKNLNFSVENGIIKMDKKTQNQYFSSYVKVQVLSLSHRCKICKHVTATEREMTEHITEHSLRELMNFS